MVDTRRSTPRNKNRVSATTPLRSPDISQAPTTGAGDDTVSTSSSKRPGLARNVQKELANLLEGNGGIAKFRGAQSDQHALSKLLDEDKATFGKRGDPIRVQIGKYVTRWSNYNKQGQYADKVLNRYGVKSASNRKKDKDKKSLTLEDISDEVSSVSSNSSSDSVQASRASKKSKKSKQSKSKQDKPNPKRKQEAPPVEVLVPEQKQDPEKKQEQEPRFQPKKKVARVSPQKGLVFQPKTKNGKMPTTGKQIPVDALLILLIHQTHPYYSSTDRPAISIDPEYPGNQGEGLVCPKFWGFEQGGVSYEGIQIEKEVDVRDVADGLYSLEIVEGTNKAFFTQPALPATYRKDKAEHEARIAADDVIKKAHNALRASYSQLSKDEQLQKIPLVFPEGYQLTVKPLVTASSVGSDKDKPVKVNAAMVAYKSDTSYKDKNQMTIYQFFGRLTWKICNGAAATTMTEQAADASAQTVADGLSGL